MNLDPKVAKFIERHVFKWEGVHSTPSSDGLYTTFGINHKVYAQYKGISEQEAMGCCQRSC